MLYFAKKNVYLVYLLVISTEFSFKTLARASMFSVSLAGINQSLKLKIAATKHAQIKQLCPKNWSLLPRYCSDTKPIRKYLLIFWRGCNCPQGRKGGPLVTLAIAGDKNSHLGI